MITAAEATKLMRGLDPEALKMHLDEIEQFIISEAKKNKNSCTIRKEPYIGWIHNSLRGNETLNEVVRVLKEKGFEISGRSSGLQITWGTNTNYLGALSLDVIRAYR